MHQTPPSHLWKKANDVTSHPDETPASPTRVTGRDSRRIQKLLAASLWSGVGLMLCVFGLLWMIKGFGYWALLLAVPLIGLGFVKGRFILDKMVKKAIVRITERGPDAPWWGFYPLRTWLLVAAMMATGIVLRVVIPDVFYHFNAPDIYFAYIGLVYLAVGVGLLHASRTWWAALRADYA